MNSKVNMAIPTLFLMLSVLFAIPSVTSAGIPNPDHIYWVSFGGPETVDPAWAYDTASGEVIQNVYEPLCQFDGMSTEAFIACLADDWPGYGTAGNVLIPSAPDAEAPAGTTETWYFHIRTGVKWHDWSISGLYLRPSDVEYSIERAMIMDHNGGPVWMLYEPLLGVSSSRDYDADTNGVIDQWEYVTLEKDIADSIQSNSTHVWFNLPAPYAPFQQILCQTVAMIIQKEFSSIANGCWNGQYAPQLAHTWYERFPYWRYRTTLAIDHTKVGADLTDFPVLVDVTNANLTKAQIDGDDILFTDGSWTKLDHEIEMFDHATGRLVAWVRVPSLSSTTDTILYIYYGNPTASNQENVAGVWDSNFKMVHHLEETTDTHYDSTMNNNDGTPEGGLNQDAIGKIDGADGFDPVENAYIRIGDDDTIDFNGTQTLEMWIKTDNKTALMILADNAAPIGSACTVHASIPIGGRFMYRRGNTTHDWEALSTSDIADGEWHYVVGIDDGNGFKIYVDGVKEYDGTPLGYGTPSTIENDLLIGSRLGTLFFFNGTIDEVRISSVNRTADWVSTSYNNQYDPSSFCAFGIEEDFHSIVNNVYVEFQRCNDPDASPLDDPTHVMCGTGPYVVVAADWDPNTGWITYEANADYWRGWAGDHVTYATMKLVNEWPNRKAQFFSTDPNMQADLCTVPRPNVPEMHVGGIIAGPTYAGFRMQFVFESEIGGLFFNYDIAQPSDYTPKLGTNLAPTLFSDRDLRLGFIYAFNVAAYIAGYWLAEAIQPTTCMPPGTAFYNSSFPVRPWNLVLASTHFSAAWGGQVWNKGIIVPICYADGDKAGEEVARMLEDTIENAISWPVGACVDIQPVAIPRSTFESEMNSGKLGVFFTEKMAYFPDPHDWFMPFMHSQGHFSGSAQHVTYGLGNIAASWPPGVTYGPPPYFNSLTPPAWITAITNTYVDSLIRTAQGETPGDREKIYNELMEIYYAEAASLPIYCSIARHYERTWVNGWIGGWNENPICPGMYFYDMWKGTVETIYSVDISAMDTCTNTTEVYPKILLFHGDMYTGGGVEAYAEIYYNITVKRLDYGDPASVVVYVGFLRNETSRAEWYFPLDYTITLGPGDTYEASGVLWWEGGRMTEGTWTVYLWVSPTGTAGAQVDESNLANNLYTSPYQVEAKELYGDILPDGGVDIFDAILLANAFGYSEGEVGYNPDADLNSDGTIDIFDAIVLANNFGNTWP